MSFESIKHLLPPIMHEIMDIIGLEATKALVDAIGGTSFRFSAGVKDCPRYRILCEAIGEEMTTKLLERFRNSDEYIPRCATAMRALYYAQFKHDFEYLTQYDKKSARMALLQLCPRYKISERTGWKIIHEQINAMAYQPGLFESPC
ncbi:MULTISPECIES: Mor transcription activator family protein [Snodgrassella]|uniref:Mor transcription activator family protein n=1 Tax=Snodgrassella TaxID=1193515 RepID=UPI000815FA1B|nr:MULTISPECIES: Mor transcription activator family protein [Snodgrassella]MCO6514882.1 mor transcription activator family protein [Snodgrassella sp.]MCO6520887.1 mor transcription activator family protein [Snodgrassella sp.]SCC12909.1 Mor transcription activator family protein [Snodgrassella sp. R-53583]